VITVIGSINLDLIAGVRRLPAPGETVTGSGFRTSPGGKGANQALAAVRAGARVRLIGAVGRDAFAAEALTFLKREGIDLSGVRETELRTGTALILVDREGENMIAVAAGANSAVTPDALRGLSLSAGDHVLLQQEIPLETVAAALEAAREAGAVSLLNVAPFREEAAGILELADYLIANEIEFDRYADALTLEGEDRGRPTSRRRSCPWSVPTRSPPRR
jgi:ribokinase